MIEFIAGAATAVLLFTLYCLIVARWLTKDPDA